MSPTPTNPAALLREAADRAREIGDPLHTALALWLNCEQHMAESAHLWTEREACGWCDTPAAGHALTVARQILGTSVCPECGTSGACNGGPCPLGTTTGQPATAPWPPAGVERPDHKLYTLLRRTGLTPEAAQQEIDTYTQTILTGQPETEAPAVRVKHSGPATAFCVLCLSGEHERVTNDQPEAEAYPAQHRWRTETYDYLADEWDQGMPYTERADALARHQVREERFPTWKDGTPVQRRVVRETTTYTVEHLAAEAQQPTPDVAEETVAACKCGHPQERHVLLSGTYAQCRHKYPEAGRPKCRCGMYRPQSDAPAS